MSIQSEHRRFKPVLDLARQLDIAINPDEQALFDAGSSGFQLWCTPHDHPEGWQAIRMIPGTFSKPCEYLGSVHWQWEGEQIVALQIETTAYALAEQLPERFTDQAEPPVNDSRRTIHNRPEDIAWLIERVTWLFEEAGVELPPFSYEGAVQAAPVPFQLALYAADGDTYVVILSPDGDPQAFCLPGYEIVHVMDIDDAGDFPLDVILSPEHDFPEPDSEPDEGPFVEQYENASRLHDDDWLEAAYEDRISGWEE